MFHMLVRDWLDPLRTCLKPVFLSEPLCAVTDSPFFLDTERLPMSRAGRALSTLARDEEAGGVRGDRCFF
ncbi:MAG: hypothetical protein B7X11_01715 [Acidobacteria bacterium 37-65-4]|nr:MAG: hypothetical protein B7X11_01715 [Acidobacteria bacterium 37-65-4]